MEVAADLAAVVFGLDGFGLSTRQMTERLTLAVSAWAIGRGWSVRREVGVSVPSSAGSIAARRGFYDLVIDPGFGSPPVAVEIDTTDKAWSLEKLRFARTNGMDAIWIRWGDEGWAFDADGVDVIQLSPSGRATDTTRLADQLAFWR